MPEVAGKAAVLVDPKEVDEIAQGIRKAIKNRERLIQAGKKQLKKFSWDKCAKQTMKVYKRAVEKKS
jgi:glycosyltransferase involved in cell wall biosynthesis